MQKVAILIPLYNNSAVYTADLVSSIESQTYQNFHVYTLDDCSSNVESRSLVHVFAEFLGEDRVTHLQLPTNVGTFRAYNILGYLAYSDRCDFVFPIGQDDILGEKCLEKMVSKAVETDVDWVNVPSPIFGDDDYTKCLGVHRPDPNATYESAWKQNPLTSFALFKMSVWNEYNGYDTSITPDDVKVGIEDCELWLRLLRDNKRYAVLPDEDLYFYRSHPAQAHRIAAQAGIDRLYNIIREKHGKEPV